jgi:hypothetical protein
LRQTRDSESPTCSQIKKLMDMAMMVTGILGWLGIP